MPTAVVARSTVEPSLTCVPSSGSTWSGGCCGPSTSRVRAGHTSRTPGRTSTIRTPATADCRRIRSSAHRGSWTGPTATAPTDRPRNAPARPPTWSACRWLTSTIASVVTPSRSRQASTGPSSGPASTSTARPGCPVASTSASPCPTSHATTAQPGGGQPGRSTRVGTRTSRRPTTTARSSGRTRRERASSTTTTTTAASSPAPAGPPGHGTTAPGTAAARSATVTSQPTAGPASQAHPCAAGIATGDSTAASTPSTVAGATAGAATRFATTVTRLTLPLRPASSGAVARQAAAGTASISATPGGTPRCRIRATHPGTTSTSAAVASTDRPNPGSAASAGSAISSPSTVAASAGTAVRSRPSARASSTMAPIAAARSTLGDGRASTTKPRSAAALSAAATRGSARSRRRSPSTAPATIARLLPETAVRWLSPAARKSSRSSAGRLRVSPTASPGSRAAGASGRTAAALRRPSRSVPAAVCHQGARPTSRGPPRTLSTATVRSLRVAGASRPSAVTGCPGSSSDQPSAGAISRTRPPPVHRPPAVCAARSTAGTSTCVAPGRRSTPEERSSRGSSPTTTCRVAAAPCPAAVRTGWSRSITACAVMTSAAASAQPPAATSTARRLRSPPSSRPPARAAPTTPPTGPVCRPSSTTAHAAPAAGTSRRSGGRVGTASAPAGRSGGPGRAGACSGTDPAPARRILDRTGSGARGAVTPAPAHAAARAAARRCPRPRGAGPPSRSGRCGCATRRSAAP